MLPRLRYFSERFPSMDIKQGVLSERGADCLGYSPGLAVKYTEHPSNSSIARDIWDASNGARPSDDTRIGGYLSIGPEGIIPINPTDDWVAVDRKLTANQGVAINNHVCPTCKNDRCSKSERSCWKCGNAL